MFGDLSKPSESGKRRMQTALQSLVSTLIHNCQAGSASQPLGLSNDVIPLAGYIATMLPSVLPDARVALVARSHAIAVGCDALVAFAAVSGAALCLCFVVLAVSYLAVRGLRDATSLPALWRDTANASVDERLVEDGSRHRLVDESLGNKRSTARDWRVTYVERPGGSEDET